MGPLLIIGFLILLGMLTLAAALVALWRFCRPLVEGVVDEEFPVAELERQINLAESLREGGFFLVGFQREMRGGGDPVWQSLFQFEGGAVWAVVEALPDESPRIVLHTFFDDGRTLTTSNGSFSDLRVTTAWEVKEGRWNGFGEQAHGHLESALSFGAKPVALATAAEFQEHYAATIGREVDELCKRDVLVEHGTKKGVFKWANWKAPFQASGALWRAGGYDWLLKRVKSSNPETEVIVEAIGDGDGEGECEGTSRLLSMYGQVRRKESVFSSLGWTKRGAILCGLMAAMLVLFLGLDELTFSTAVAIGVVILLHEFGHVLAMRFFGARDDRVMTLPFLARWAGNRKSRVPARQQFFVLLMGPLPGLLVGWGLLVIAAYVPGLPGFLKQFALWLVLYNNLSLLPLVPFDGGRLMSLLVFERFPRGRLVYLAVSGMTVFVAVVVMQAVSGWPAWPLLLLPVATLLALPDAIRSVKPASRARKLLSARDDETEALHKAVEIVEEDKGLARLKTGRQVEFVDKLLDWGCTKRPGVGGTVFATVLYLAMLGAPFWVMIGLAVGEEFQVRKEQRMVAARIAELEAEVTRPAVVVTRRTRSELKLLEENYQEALAQLYSGGDVEIDSEVFDFDSRGIYDPGEALRMVRTLQWDQVAVWINEENSQSRQETAKVLVQTLIGDAREQAISGKHRRASDNLSKAYWAVSKCRPTASLATWIDWLYLEYEVLGMLEEALGKGHLHPQYAKWFAVALRGGSEVHGKEMAILLLRDLGGAPGPALPEETGNAGIMATDAVLVENRKGSKIGNALSGSGFALRRSRPDTEFRSRRKDRSPSGFGNLLSVSRILRGLPTRSELASGLTVAENWAGGRVIDLDVAFELEDVEQRRIWEARILCMERLVHYRHLGAVAFETELSGRIPGTGPRNAASTRAAGAQATLIGGGARNYAVMSQSLDKTLLRWRLSPGFHPKKPEPPAPAPKPPIPPSRLVVDQGPQPGETSPSGVAREEVPAGQGTAPAETVDPPEKDESEDLDEFNLLDEFDRMRTAPGWGGKPPPSKPPVPAETEENATER